MQRAVPTSKVPAVQILSKLFHQSVNYDFQKQTQKNSVLCFTNCTFTATFWQIAIKQTQFAKCENKKVFAKKLRFLFFTLAIMKGYTKRKSTAIKINLSAANAPPPKGYYLFLLDDLEWDTIRFAFHKTRDPFARGRVNIPQRCSCKLHRQKTRS